MVADFNTMPEIYRHCKHAYFNNDLPTPKFRVIHSFKILARFQSEKTSKKDKASKGLRGKLIKNPVISFTDYFDFDKQTFINIMAHEMIHYYIALHGIKDNNTHGREFMRMADELNEKYGLNITKSYDASSLPLTAFASKPSWWHWLLPW